jgi:hypothetical protein
VDDDDAVCRADLGAMLLDFRGDPPVFRDFVGKDYRVKLLRIEIMKDYLMSDIFECCGCFMGNGMVEACRIGVR